MGEKLKVAHVTYTLSIGGVTNVINQLVSDPKQDVDQFLILLSEDEKSISDEIAGVRIYKLNCKLPEEYSLRGFLGICLKPGRYYREIVKKLKEIYDIEKFDIYHFHGLPKDLPIGRLLQKRSAVKLVYTDHLLRISDGEYSTAKTKVLAFIYRQFYKSYNTIFVSQAIFDVARRLGFVSRANKNRAIENSIDSRSIVSKTDYSLRENIRIVYVSRISAVKGHFLLLPVAEQLKHKYGVANFQFVLIGPGELLEELQKQIEKRNLTSFFKIEGAQSNVTSLLPYFDLGVFPSEREGLPIALLEKMAAGLPVVASDIPEIKNVIQNKDEALLFPVNNTEACAEQLYKLLQDEEMRRKIGAAARRAVEQRYATPLLDKYIEFYNQLT